MKKDFVFSKLYILLQKEGYLLKFFLDGNKAEILSEILGNDLIIENPKGILL